MPFHAGPAASRFPRGLECPFDRAFDRFGWRFLASRCLLEGFDLADDQMHHLVDELLEALVFGGHQVTDEGTSSAFECLTGVVPAAAA